MNSFKSVLVSRGELTQRESEIALCVCDAMTDKQIARLLAISLKTVTNHIDHIHHKLGINQAILNKRVALLRVLLVRGMVRVGCLVWALFLGSQLDDQVGTRAGIRGYRTTISGRRFE